MRKSLILIMSLLLVAVASSIAAQSTDRDHPALITSNEIRGDLNHNDEENFYSFVAGPGELTITVDVKANPDEQALLNFELLERDAATQILCCEYAQGNGGGTGRDVKSVKLANRRTIILHTTNGPIGGGTFQVRLSGAAVSGLAAGQR
ncbi:MAG TPA: hypothetical protein VK619_00430 [Pyrinomonadaceae bacterium]|nr:hypothetical protein [Pyrinomonadaceae bacterium]